MKIEKRIFSVEEKKKIREFILTNGDKMTNEQMYIAQNINCMQQAGIIVGMKTSKLIPHSIRKYSKTRKPYFTYISLTSFTTLSFCFIE